MRYNPRLMAVLLLSFSSGLPLVLIGSTLQAWYTVAGVDLLTIGVLSLVGQPYVFKFLWAPLLDRFTPNRLGRRRGWIFITQIGLVVGLVGLAFLNPSFHPWWMAILALGIAFVSASQDIAVDAYRTDVLMPNERAMGAAFTNFGYRIAMLVAGAIALILAAKIGWQWTYLMMALLLLSEIIVTLFAPVPSIPVEPPATLKAAIVEPIKDILNREYAWLFLIFIITYKLCDAFALSLNTPFLIRGVGFSLIDVGSITKIVGLVGTLLGVLMGGLLMPRFKVYRSLLYFGFLQAASNLLFMALALVGKNYAMMVIAVFGEYFFGGLSNVVMVALLMSLCHPKYTATQYAVYSALSAVGRVFAGPLSAIFVSHWGWSGFYFFTFLIGLPPLALLFWLKKQLSYS